MAGLASAAGFPSASHQLCSPSNSSQDKCLSSLFSAMVELIDVFRGFAGLLQQGLSNHIQKKTS